MTRSANMTAEWQRVREALDAMRATLDGERVDLIAFAKAYAAVSDAVLEATRAAGQTSLRFAAVRRALDLRTPKSELERFVEKM